MQRRPNPVGGIWPNRVLKLVGLIFTTQAPLIVLGLLVRNKHINPVVGSFALYIFIALYLGAISLAGFLYMRDSGERPHWLGLRDWGLVVLGYLGIIFANGLSQVLSQLLGHGSEATNQQTIQQLARNSHSFGMVMLVISLVVGAPILEELIFRGVLMNWFFRDRRWAAILLSAIAFGGIHVAGDPNWPYTIIGYAGMGLVLALVYSRSHNIAVDITVHMLNNAVATLSLLSLVLR